MTSRTIDTGTNDLQAVVEDGIAVITMNRPDRRNAMSGEMLAGLQTALADVETSPDARCVVLTGAEFRVLELLMRSAGQVLSRDHLTEAALGRKLVPYDRSIDTHISNLRRKLNLEQGRLPELKNVRGAGYMLAWAPD